MTDWQAIAREAVSIKGAIQHMHELAQFYEVLEELQSEVILEIGCDKGGGLWAWQQLNPRRLIAIDWPNQMFGTHAERISYGAEVLEGNSQTEEMVERLAKTLDGDRIDFLFIDADHRYKGVQADHENYSPFVRPGGIVAFHDISPICDGRVGVDVYWRELKRYRETFEIQEQPNENAGMGIGYYYV